LQRSLSFLYTFWSHRSHSGSACSRRRVAVCASLPRHSSAIFCPPEWGCVGGPEKSLQCLHLVFSNSFPAALASLSPAHNFQRDLFVTQIILYPSLA
jgi:hypothetical protein